MKAPLPLKRMRRGTQANNDCLAPSPNQTEDWCPPETKNGMWSGLLIRFYPEPSGGFLAGWLICFEARKHQLKLPPQ
ncbi:hypothetical protein P5673_006414 [Acropora cervicornis]|uniref:Uncharacterized protein n=1 Tax=Acropora cervicornis TaxID=6130 RepID=A0AAD9VCZ2_ACRCE|nr:hypothetical protein P5673_006414 [Acropora cervicornis]